MEIEHLTKERLFVLDSIDEDDVSPVPETDEDFDNEQKYAFYEIGPKEDYPEYIA
jgi:hypothetical protein